MISDGDLALLNLRNAGEIMSKCNIKFMCDY